MKLPQAALLIGLSLLLLFVAATASAFTGPVRLPFLDVARELIGISALDTRDHAILWSIRLPRVAMAIVVGATLAVAGAAYQAVFRNPLADPYLLGVSSGAGLGVTVAVVAGASIGFGGGALGIVGAAFVGGVIVRDVHGQPRRRLQLLRHRRRAGRRGGGPASAAQTYVQQRTSRPSSGLLVDAGQPGT